MVRCFVKGNRYRHSNPNCTLDIQVISVFHVNDERVVLKVFYPHRVGNRIQYTGMGKDGHTDTIRIRKVDFPHWELVLDT